jgi:hypothetical protein
MLPTSAASARVREWQQRKDDHVQDPLLGPGDSPRDAVLAGAVSATATFGGNVIAITNNAITTNAGARVWFPVQHVNKHFLAPSTKRWR